MGCMCIDVIFFSWWWSSLFHFFSFLSRLIHFIIEEKKRRALFSFWGFGTDVVDQVIGVPLCVNMTPPPSITYPGPRKPQNSWWMRKENKKGWKKKCTHFSKSAAVFPNVYESRDSSYLVCTQNEVFLFSFFFFSYLFIYSTCAI